MRITRLNDNRILTGVKMEIINATLDGSKIAFTSETVFHVQIGRGRGSYKTAYSIKGSLGQAVWYYNCVNIGRGYKKRLFVPTFNKPILARQFS
jgi:hypothetical protein